MIFFLGICFNEVIFETHKKPKYDFVKISEELVMKLRNSLRNVIVRFYREMFMKNSDKLREDLLRISVIKLIMKHKESLKDYFVKIIFLIMKSRKNLRNYIVRFPEELFMKNRDRLRYEFLRIPAVNFSMKHEESLKS